MSEPTSPQLGKYQLVARLATGGMAEIYLARQAGAGSFSRLVVLKRILPHLAEEARFVDMFLEEARLASQIRHPNVVQIYDVDQEGADYYIAMEYIDGLSLGSICRRGRKRRIVPPFHVSAEIIAQACEGLHAAHELCDEAGIPLGVVHRDVSPHNLMVDKTGVVKLVDFGIAKATTTAIRTRTGDIKGKYPYMSPEQVRAEVLDRRTDIFSLGTIFAELVLSQRFFERASELATLKAITEEPIATMTELDPQVPTVLSDIIARALQRNREDRYQTAEEMGIVVRRVIDTLGERTSTRTVSKYLTTQCKDLIEARARAVRDVGQIEPIQVSSVPRVSGFEESTSTVGGNGVDAADLTKPMKKPPTMAGQDEEGEPSETSDSSKSEASPERTKLRIWLSLAIALVVIGAAGVATALYLGRSTRPTGPVLRYAHPPTFAPETVRKGFEPLQRYLETKLDRPVDIVVTNNYGTLREQLISGKLHLANLSPLLFVQARHRSPDVVPLASHTYEGARSYQSYLVTRTDSGITSLEQVKGQRFCFVDRGSTSGYLLPRQFLRENGLDPETAFASIVLSGTHTKVMQDVVARRCDVGAVYSAAFTSASELGVASSQLRLLTVAGSTPWDVVCASPKLPAGVAARIRKILLDFQPQRDLGQKIVSDIFRIDGFVEPHLEDFEPVEEAVRAEGLIDE